MAKFLDGVGIVLYAVGADMAAYNIWLKAYRLRQKNGELDE